jgi:hypothetical protein
VLHRHPAGTPDYWCSTARPQDEIRDPFDRTTASAHHAEQTARADDRGLGVQQTSYQYYLNVGPLFADPLARLLYAEIASIEEQHVTQYESIIDPTQSWLEQWLMHEAMEAYNYYGCVQQETNPRIKAIWERFLDYELGHFQAVADLFKQIEGRDPAEVIPDKLPDPFPYASQREFVRRTLSNEVDLRTLGSEFVGPDEEGAVTLAYRKQMNSKGSPTEAVAAGYHWQPGTEIIGKAA